MYSTVGNPFTVVYMIVHYSNLFQYFLSVYYGPYYK